MANLPKAGAQLELDTSLWDSAYKSVLSEAGKLDSLAPTVKVGVDDTELKNAASKADELNTSTSLKANVDDTELQNLADDISDIKALAVIDVSLALTEAASGILETLKGLPGLGQVVANDNAQAILSVRSGAADPEELALAQDLFANNMVESVEAGALLINQFKAMGVTGIDALTDAANGAVNASQAFLAVGQEAEASEIAIAQHQLVVNGLAKDYAEASDIIAAGTAEGLNQGDDFLDTIREYASTFGNAGVSAQEFLSILNTGLEAGFDNTDRVADLFRETTLRALNPDETAAQDSLRALGLADETAALQAGEITGAKWLEGVIAAIQAEENGGKRQKFAADIFGTQAEDFGVATVLGVNPVDAVFDEIEGRAAEISTLLNSTVGNAFTELFNTINLEVAELLSSDAINLDQKLEDIKTAIQTTIDEIQTGSDLKEAIEIGFNIPGFADSVSRFEASVANFAIGVLEIIASVQDFLGKDSSGTRTEIERLAGNQLAFNLKVANEEEVSGEIQRAIDRGVDTSAIEDAAGTALTELINSGEFAKAQTLIDSLNELEGGAPMVAPGLTGLQITEAEAALRDGSIERIQEQIDKGNLIAPVDVDTTQFQGRLDAALYDLSGHLETFQQTGFWDALLPTGVGDSFQAQLDALEAGFEQAAEPSSNFWSAIIPPEDLDISGRADEIATEVKPAKEAMTQLAATTGEDMEQAGGVFGTAVDAINAKVDELTAQVSDADTSIANSITGNTITASFDAMGESATVNAGIVEEAMQIVRASAARTDVVLKTMFNSILANVASANEAIVLLQTTGGGGGGTTNNTTINVNQNNTINGGAQSAANGYELAAQIRGAA